MDYSNWTDFAINAAVGAATGEARNSEPLLKLVIRNSNGRRYDPCNNAADAWPIIEKHGITLAFDGSDWWATSDACWVDGCEWQIEGEISRKPLRAAMIVFLMMQESE